MKRKIIALILATAMTMSIFSACSITRNDDKSSSKKKHSRDKDDDDDDKPDQNPIDLSYENAYLPYYEKAETSSDSMYEQIEDRYKELGIKRDGDDIYFSLDGSTLIGSDGSEYVFDNAEIYWYKNSDHSDNYHYGDYSTFRGCDAGIYMISNGYATAQSYTDYYDRNAGDEFYIPENLIVIEFNLYVKHVDIESDEDITLIFYGYTDGNHYDLWGFSGDVSNGNTYTLTKQ